MKILFLFLFIVLSVTCSAQRQKPIVDTFWTEVTYRDSVGLKESMVYRIHYGKDSTAFFLPGFIWLDRKRIVHSDSTHSIHYSRY